MTALGKSELNSPWLKDRLRSVGHECVLNVDVAGLHVIRSLGILA